MFKKLFKFTNRLRYNADNPPMVVEHKSINIFKGVCPMCVAHPIEYLSVMEYSRKYPAEYHIEFGYVNVYLCKVHAKELVETMRQPIPAWEDDWKG